MYATDTTEVQIAGYGYIKIPIFHDPWAWNGHMTLVGSKMSDVEHIGTWPLP